MTDLEATDAIKNQLLAVWPAASGAILAASFPDLAAIGAPIYFVDENQSEPNPPIPWGELTIQHGQTRQYTMGRPAKWLTQGTIFIMLRWPAVAAGDTQDGEAMLLRLGSALRDVFQAKQLAEDVGEDGVITYALSLSDAVASDDGRWWILVASIPFEYTEYR